MAMKINKKIESIAVLSIKLMATITVVFAIAAKCCKQQEYYDCVAVNVNVHATAARAKKPEQKNEFAAVTTFTWPKISTK